MFQKKQTLDNWGKNSGKSQFLRLIVCIISIGSLFRIPTPDRKLVSCMNGLTEDWSIPVFRRPSSGTLLRRRTIFVRGGVSPPGSWPAGGHIAVTWPRSAPTKGRSWSRRVWWRCPIITSSLNWKKKKSKKSKKNSTNHMVSWQHINQDVFFFQAPAAGGF